MTIETLAELRRAMCDECSFKLNGKVCEDDKPCLFIRLISDFESSVRARIDELEITLKNWSGSEMGRAIFQNIVNELRRLLGEAGI